VDIRTSTGLNYTRIVKRSTLRIPAPALAARMRVTLAGTSRTGVTGPSATFAKRLARPGKHHR
jgi:hypothetical protein